MEAVRLDAQSIEDAKRALEEANIDEMLGDSDSSGYVGPKAPKLPPITYSMNARDFTLSALAMEGTNVAEEEIGVYSAEGKDIRERICFRSAPR